MANVDAEIPYLVACWPISDPLARYRMALAKGNERLVQAHRDYFGNEDAMTEGNAQLALKRRGNVILPSRCSAGDQDDNVTPDIAETFAPHIAPAAAVSS